MGGYDSVKARAAAAKGASMVGLRGVRVTRVDGLGRLVTHTDRDRAYATHACPPSPRVVSFWECWGWEVTPA